MPAVVGFVPCAGAAIHLPDPNNLSTVNWTNTNLGTPTFTATDPNGVANNATDLKGTIGSGAFNTFVNNTTQFTLLAATGTYSFGAYLKSIAGPPWVLLLVGDGGGNQFAAFYNIATATPNGLSGAGTWVGDCARAAPAGNGYTQVSLAGHVTSDAINNVRFSIYLVDSGSTGNSTLNQEIYAWQVSP